MDTIGDYLTMIRNAMKAKKKVVEIPRSNVRLEITKILYENGYILNYKEDKNKNVQGTVKIALKYDRETGTPAIKKIGRISTPGLRNYSGSKDLPRIINGLGISIISSSSGIITDKQARKLNVGGEVLCYVY
ncbi:MAG: 30S ribosomal protein S8 [Bacteroidota bacterium]|nr:30S ribosomal protein S8 [Bacteroidota bacterium]